MGIQDYLHSVADVWLLWISSAAAFLGLASRFHIGVRRGRRIPRGERGASYSLSTVIVFPFYVLLIAVIAESTLMLTVKLGTLYAAYSAARAAAVWLPSEAPLPQKEAMVRLAGHHALTPFASSLSSHVRGVGRQGRVGSPEDRDYYRAYRGVSDGRLSLAYFSRKRQYAIGATEVAWGIEPAQADDPLSGGYVTATVRYQMPLQTPGVGRLLGSPAPWPGADFYTRTIESTARLQLETPKSADGKLGIQYDSWNL